MKVSEIHFDHLIGGLFSGLFSCILLQPLDLSKTRMQQNPVKLSLTATIKDIYQANGIFALWRGIPDE
jgi:solute carrier family 25, member 38